MQQPVEQNRYSPSLTMALLIAKELRTPVEALFELNVTLPSPRNGDNRNK